MKTLVTGLLFLMIFTANAHANSNESAECKEWGKAWSALHDGKIVSKSLSPAVAIDLLKHYPGPIEGADGAAIANEKPADTMLRILLRSGCAPMAFYDIEKYLLESKLSASEKQEAKKLIFAELKKEFEVKAGLISLLLRSRTLEAMSDQGWFKLNDAAYFEFTRISSEAKHLGNELRMNAPFLCDVAQECKEEDIKKDLKRIRYESSEVGRIYDEFMRWANRIKP